MSGANVLSVGFWITEMLLGLSLSTRVFLRFSVKVGKYLKALQRLGREAPPTPPTQAQLTLIMLFCHNLFVHA